VSAEGPRRPQAPAQMQRWLLGAPAAAPAWLGEWERALLGNSALPGSLPPWLVPRWDSLGRCLWLGLCLWPGRCLALLARQDRREDPGHLVLGLRRDGALEALRRLHPGSGDATRPSLYALAGPAGRWAVALDSEQALSLLAGTPAGEELAPTADQHALLRGPELLLLPAYTLWSVPGAAARASALLAAQDGSRSGLELEPLLAQLGPWLRSLEAAPWRGAVALSLRHNAALHQHLGESLAATLAAAVADALQLGLALVEQPFVRALALRSLLRALGPLGRRGLLAEARAALSIEPGYPALSVEVQTLAAGLLSVPGAGCELALSGSPAALRRQALERAQAAWRRSPAPAGAAARASLLARLTAGLRRPEALPSPWPSWFGALLLALHPSDSEARP